MKQLIGRVCKRDGVAVIGVEHAGTRCGATGRISMGTWSQVEDEKKGNSEKADTIVARSLPEHRKVLRTSFKLTILLPHRRVQIGLGRLLLLCTLTLPARP